jgi:hypothetical protein
MKYRDIPLFCSIRDIRHHQDVSRLTTIVPALFQTFRHTTTLLTWRKTAMKFIFSLFKGGSSLILLACIPLGNVLATYQPPVGIPAPSFGINEKLSQYYQRPTPWVAETPGWYFIDQYHPDASDSNIHGTPDNPRQTLPPQIPAGSVVEINGDYDYAPIGYDVVEAQGVQNQPVFIRGTGNNSRVLRKLVIKSSYTIIENLEFTQLGKLTVVYPSHHVSIRNNNHHHIAGKIGGYGTSDNERVHHIVIYNNLIHSQDGWDASPDIDFDNHGIKFGAWVEDVWVLHNTGYNNRGSFIQIGDWNNPADNSKTRRYYVGRNHLSANRQSPIGIKQATDIIVSENHLFNNQAIQTNAAGQSGVVYQYGPDNVWIINNHIHHSNAGITSGSNSGGIGEDIYIIGNLIHDIHVTPDFIYNPETAWAPAAIVLAGGVNRYIINNSIYNADAGISTPSSGPMIIANNIISDISLNHHIFIERGTSANISQLNSNILHQPGGATSLRWGSNQIWGLIEWENNHAPQGTDNLESDPLFADPENGEFQLLDSSPGYKATVEHQVFLTFQQRYGLDIRKDLMGTPRPVGGWNTGAIQQESTLLFDDGFE